jgi:Transposase DDE domain
MAGHRKPALTAKSVGGLKYFQRLQPLFARLHAVGTDHDHAGNRQLHFDHYASLILLYFFNPCLTSLRGIQEATNLDKVQKKLGVPRTSLGSLSAAARVFDPEPLQALVAELAAEALPLEAGREAEVLRGLTAVDGSLLPALPKMAWALWVDGTHHAAKLHLHFDVFKGVPCRATLTHGSGNERTQLKNTLQADRLYVIDRGYAEYQLFQDIIDADASFIGRIRDDADYRVVEERPLSGDAKAAGVMWDRVVWLGGPQSGQVFQQTLRIVAVRTGKTDREGRPEVLLLASSCLDLDAAWIALGYKFRWSVELFFRWFKCILGCQHLLSTCRNGVAIQVYLALIASLVVSLWTGQKPTKRTFEMICHYFCGWASEAELRAHIRKLGEAKKAKSKKS